MFKSEPVAVRLVALKIGQKGIGRVPVGHLPSSGKRLGEASGY
jgi:hypothetical protein